MWIPLDKSSDIGAFGCVYILWNVDTGHVYVGTSCNASKRLLQWACKIWDCRPWKVAIVLRSDNYQERHCVEAAMIYKTRQIISPELVLNRTEPKTNVRCLGWQQFSTSPARFMGQRRGPPKLTSPPLPR
jgi:hypothetical protein